MRWKSKGLRVVVSIARTSARRTRETEATRKLEPPTAPTVLDTPTILTTSPSHEPEIER